MMRRLGASLVTVLALGACSATSINFDAMTAEDLMKLLPSEPKKGKR